MPTYDPTTALLVVDVQNDFADPKGSLYVKGGEQVVPFINAEIDAAEKSGARIFYTQDWHPESTPHFKKDGGIWPVHCVQNTWGAELPSDLVVGGPVIQKGSHGEDGYSGFTMRDPVSGDTDANGLGRHACRGRRTRLVLAGLATDYCVKSTVLDARERGYPITVFRTEFVRSSSIRATAIGQLKRCLPRARCSSRGGRDSRADGRGRLDS